MSDPYVVTQRDWRAVPAIMLFGKAMFDDLIHSSLTQKYICRVEAGFNRTPSDMEMGRPLIRCLGSAGGAESVVYNTMITGGADETELGDEGCFLNFAGCSPIQIRDNQAGASRGRTITLFFPSITANPINGSTLTQAVSLATGTVIDSSQTYGYIQIVNLDTGIWNATNTVTDSGGTLMPIHPAPRDVVFGVDWEGNADQRGHDDLIWYITEGYAEAFVQGDDTGVGYNGNIADCTPLTWNCLERCFVAAYYQAIASIDTNYVYVGQDNVIAHAMEGAGGNSDHLPEIILIYMRAEKPLGFVEATKQGQFYHNEVPR